MKKPNFKLNLKKLTYSQKKSDWQKSVLLVIYIGIAAFVLVLAYVYFRPINKDIKSQIESEVNSDPINIDSKTLETLKNKAYIK